MSKRGRRRATGTPPGSRLTIDVLASLYEASCTIPMLAEMAGIKNSTVRTHLTNFYGERGTTLGEVNHAGRKDPRALHVLWLMHVEAMTAKAAGEHMGLAVDGDELVRKLRRLARVRRTCDLWRMAMAQGWYGPDKTYPSRKGLSEAERIAATLYAQGVPIAAIVSATRVPLCRLYAVLHKLGIPTRRRIRPSISTPEMVRLHRRLGLSYEEIAGRAGISPSSVGRRIGGYLRPRGA